MGEAMADQDFSHTAEIMKAALPYIDSRTRVLAEFFTKAFDLMGSLKLFTSFNLAACGFEGTKTDMEGLLTGIRPLCTLKEREFVDRILNFFNMKRMFEMYNNMMSAMKTMQEFDGFPFGDSGTGDDTDNVTGNFSNLNFESIFGNSKDSSDKEEAETKQESSDSDSNKSMQNNKMFEMLKAMVPPEQMSTFENLSMLLNSMTYDNNSKPDDHKERNDG
jgi:hypothetical protein